MAEHKLQNRILNFLRKAHNYLFLCNTYLTEVQRETSPCTIYPFGRAGPKIIICPDCLQDRKED